MEKSVIAAAAATLIWCSILGTAATASPESPKAVEKWIETLTHKQEKVTKLHFYFHRLAGAATTGVAIATATTMINPNPMGFGSAVIKDDPMTVGPELSSTHIGYSQGLSATSSLEDIVLTEYFTLYFTDPTRNGSTLAILGSNPLLHKYREMPIVGGTGVFRLARGIATYQTYFYNATTREACVEADLVVFHF
ncbi:hypothetical protein C2S51_016709 [Perilla frutescens var. frutescens]|nr:hypothetical protein C2S51_016709 [Perilla frutescens var. frutescens]